MQCNPIAIAVRGGVLNSKHTLRAAKSLSSNSFIRLQDSGWAGRYCLTSLRIDPSRMATENNSVFHGEYELGEESPIAFNSDLSKLDLTPSLSYDEWMQHDDNEFAAGTSQNAASSGFVNFDLLPEEDAPEDSGSKSHRGPREKKRRVQNREA
jgi:hypothetical protein